MSALTIYLKKIALAALWALTLALLVLSLGWMPLARATDLAKPLIGIRDHRAQPLGSARTLPQPGSGMRSLSSLALLTMPPRDTDRCT
jgi:hypothetical protein